MDKQITNRQSKIKRFLSSVREQSESNFDIVAYIDETIEITKKEIERLKRLKSKEKTHD